MNYSYEEVSHTQKEKHEMEAEVGSHSICLGQCAGKDLIAGSYQLVIIPEGCKELRTTMTPSEFEIVNKVIRRALRESGYEMP